MHHTPSLTATCTTIQLHAPYIMQNVPSLSATCTTIHHYAPYIMHHVSYTIHHTPIHHKPSTNRKQQLYSTELPHNSLICVILSHSSWGHMEEITPVLSNSFNAKAKSHIHMDEFKGHFASEILKKNLITSFER